MGNPDKFPITPKNIIEINDEEEKMILTEEIDEEEKEEM